MTPQAIKIGDLVKTWQNTMGRVAGLTQDGWFMVRDLVAGGSDEWQGFQLTLVADNATGRIL